MSHVSAFSLVLSFFVSFRSFFFICVSSRISHPGFDFLFVLFKGPRFSHKLILPLHRLVQFNSVNAVLCWYICLYLIHFFVSILIVLHSMFLSGGKVVFRSFIILFKFPKFIFCSCVCSVLLGWLFSEVGGSFLLDCSCLSKSSVSYTVLVSCSFFFWCISSISFSENQTFFLIVLTWSTSLWLVVWKFAHACQISIILFLYARNVGLHYCYYYYLIFSFTSGLLQFFTGSLTKT